MIPEWEAAWGFGDGFHAPAHLALNGAAERGLEPLKGMGMLRRATWSKEERGGGCGGGWVSFGNVPSEFDQIPWILGLGEEFGLGVAVTGCHKLALVPPFFSPLFQVSGSLRASVSLSSLSQHGGCVWARLGSPPWWHRGQEAVPPPVTVTAWCPPGWGSSHEGCFSFAKLQSICFPGRKAFYYYYYHYYYFFLLHLERASIPRRHPRGPALAEIRCSFGDKSWGKISIKVDAL